MRRALPFALIPLLVLAACGGATATATASGTAERETTTTSTPTTPADRGSETEDESGGAEDPTDDWRRVRVGPYSLELPSGSGVGGLTLPGLGEDTDIETVMVPGGTMAALWLEVPTGEDVDVLTESLLEGLLGVFGEVGGVETSETTTLGEPARDLRLTDEELDLVSEVRVVLPDGGLLMMQTAGRYERRDDLAALHRRMIESLRPA